MDITPECYFFSVTPNRMLLILLLKIACFSSLKPLDSHTWAVLGEGCSSARDPSQDPGAFIFSSCESSYTLTADIQRVWALSDAAGFAYSWP